MTWTENLTGKRPV